MIPVLGRSWASSARAVSRSDSGTARQRRSCRVPCFGEGAGPVLKELAEFCPVRGWRRCGAGSARAAAAEHAAAQAPRAAVLPDPGGFGGGGPGAGLGDGGPGCPACWASCLRSVASATAASPGGLGGLDGVVAFGLGGGDALLCLTADLLGLGGVGGGGLGEPVVGLTVSSLLGSQAVRLCPRPPRRRRRASGRRWRARRSASARVVFGGRGPPARQRHGRLRLRLRPRWGRPSWPRLR